MSADEKTPEANTEDLEALKRELAELRGAKASYESALSSERQRRVEAERARMSEAERFVVSQQDACEESISRLETDIDNLTTRYAELADEPGNGKALADISRQIAKAEARLLSEGQRKEYLATERERAKLDSQRAAAPAGKVLANGAPLEGFSPAQKSWLERHDRAFTDQAYLDRVNAAAHSATVLQGLTPDTPEWFASIEEAIGDRRAPVSRETPAADEGEDVTAQSPYSTPRQPQGQTEDQGDLTYHVDRPQGRAAGPGSIAAAPPSRTIPGAQAPTGKGRSPTLTAEEREVADSLYSTIPNAADRYRKYAESRSFMNGRQNSHFVN